MKHLLPLSRMMSLLFIGSLLFMSSCTDTCEEVYTYTTMEPIYLSYEDLRNQSIETTAAKNLQNPGKIYFKSPYILINERNKGIHIIDNSNPAVPNNVGFIEIAGNIDMAVKNNTLYADSYTDLLAIDITDPTTPILQKRVNDAFAENFSINEAEGGILIEYEAVEHIETYDCDEEPPIQPNQNGGVFIDESEIWLEFLDERSISWCNWSIADKAESSAIFLPNFNPDGDWPEDRISESGLYVRGKLLEDREIDE